MADSKRHWVLNQTIPAPLDEKTMFSLYVFNSLSPHLKEVADFYERLRDEVKDRVERGIAAWPSERFRFITDSQPPWAFLQVFRHLERVYGAVSVGPVCSYALQVNWDFDEQGNFVPARPSLFTSIGAARARRAGRWRAAMTCCRQAYRS